MKKIIGIIVIVLLTPVIIVTIRVLMAFGLIKRPEEDVL